MFGKGQHDELLRELTWLRRRVSELEEDRARGLRLASVTDATRSHDQLGRTAQAEFGLLLPDTDAHGALPALERPSDRPYRAARPHLDAVEELTRCAGRQFDPRVTEAVIGHLYGQRQARLAAS